MDARQPEESGDPLVLRLFGPMEGRLYGQPLPRLRIRKGQWLLALLALRHDREVHRDWLAGVLWPESPASQALYNLRRCLSDLRRALGAEGERLSSPTARTVWLSLAGARVDALAFDSAIARGDMASLEEAISLYRGPLLEGCTEEWILAERQERELAYLTALETLAAQAMARQDAQAASRHLRLVVATDPLRETAQRALMEALAAGGDVAAATLVYREYRLYLHRTLHTEPAPQTSALFQLIRHQAQQATQQQTPSASRRAAPSLPGRLPLPLTRFVGREQELAAITGLLAKTRLVTLMGPGGVGKTRLAIQLARQLTGHYPDGAWFVDLAGLSDAAQIPEALASVLEIWEEFGRPLLEVLAEHLSRKQALLVLDNFEHLVEEGAGIIRGLLERVPGLACLVTSRQQLAVEGECEFPVAPLLTPSLSGTRQHLLKFPSVQLFLDRAQAVRPEFQLTDANATVVAVLCCRLEGIPLAIEIAAARAAVLTPAQIVAQLERRLDFLISHRRDITDRHRSLRAAIEASYRLLPEPLQCFFTRLSVFRSGWTLEAAEGICEEPLALDYLEQLRAHSLILAEESTEAIRFKMLESIREFAYEHLKEQERVKMERRHADYFYQCVLDAQLGRTGDKTWFERFEEDLDNLRAVLVWSLQPGNDLKMGRLMSGKLFRFWNTRGRVAEGRMWYARLLDQAEETPTEELGQSLYGAGALASLQGDFQAAQPLLKRCLVIAQALENDRLKANAYNELGSIQYRMGDYEQARFYYDKMLTLARAQGNRLYVASALGNLANVAQSAGDFTASRAFNEESLEIWREEGDRHGEAVTLHNLAILAHSQGQLAAARAYYEQSLEIKREVADAYSVSFSLTGIAGVALDQGDYMVAAAYARESLALARELDARMNLVYILNVLTDLARALGESQVSARMYGTLERVREEMSYPLTPVEQRDYEKTQNILRESLGTGVYAAAKTEGRTLSLEQALACLEELLAGRGL